MANKVCIINEGMLLVIHKYSSQALQSKSQLVSYNSGTNTIGRGAWYRKCASNYRFWLVMMCTWSEVEEQVPDFVYKRFPLSVKKFGCLCLKFDEFGSWAPRTLEGRAKFLTSNKPTKRWHLLDTWAPSLWSVGGSVRSAARKVNPYRADNRWSASQGMEHQDDQTSYPFEKYPALLPHSGPYKACSKKWLVVGPPLQLFEIGE